MFGIAIKALGAPITVSDIWIIRKMNLGKVILKQVELRNNKYYILV